MRRSVWTPLVATALVLFLEPGDRSLLAASDYTVRAEDKLRIRVYQFPELSGEFTVSSAGRIFMPPIGEIPVAGLSTNDISGRISDHLIKGGYSQKPGTMVELLQSRPIFVLGDVQRPGEYAYRPGLTILQAISLAGGHFRFTDPGLLRLERDVVATRGELATLLKRVNYLVARRARVNAELEAQSEIVFPPELTQQATNPTIAQLLTEERSILTTNRDTLQRQVENLERSRVLYEREIEAITAQIEAGKRELESVQKEFDDVMSLRQQGLSSLPRQLALERTQAQLVSAQHGLQTLVLRARQNITELEQKISGLESERRVKLNAEMQQTRLELEESRSRIETTRKLIIEAEVTAPTMTARRGSRGHAKEYSFLIVRKQEGKATSLPADENTALEPGDVVKVEREDPSSYLLGAETTLTRPIFDNAH
jgi:exopolysaccharide production protein ExoF